MNLTSPDPSRSRIVLAGTPAYASPDLPDVPQITANIADLASVLTDPELGGFDHSSCVIVPPHAGVSTVGRALVQAAGQAEDLLLFYYAGHGLLGPESRELYLSVADTEPKEMLPFTALPFTAVRQAFRSGRARSRVVILDSCFSGRAIAQSLAGEEVIGQIEVAGSYVLTAAPANRTALVLAGEPHTAFTHRLLDVLATGIAGAGELLNLDAVFRKVQARSRAEGLPVPEKSGTATADLLGLVRNRRHAPAVVVPAQLPEQLRSALDSSYPRIRVSAIEELAAWLTDPDPARVLTARTVLAEADAGEVPVVAQAAREVLARSRHAEQAPAAPTVPVATMDTATEMAATVAAFSKILRGNRAVLLAGAAERVASNITDQHRKALALADVAVAVAPADPNRAARLADAVERVASEITDQDLKTLALKAAARALAAVDPDRAEHVSSALSDQIQIASAQADVAVVVAVVDPDRAARLAEAVERVASDTTDQNWKRSLLFALTRIARALAAADPDRAEGFAIRITDQYTRASALEEIAQVVAAADPFRATRLAYGAEHAVARITDQNQKVSAMAGVAQVVALVDPDRAERVASAITDPDSKECALHWVARTIAAADPDRAERIASGLASPYWKAPALAAVAAAAGPDRLAWLADAAEDAASSITDQYQKESVLADIAGLVAAADPDRAECIASGIISERRKAEATSAIVWALAAADPDRAERIASGITDQRLKVLALTAVIQAMMAVPRDTGGLAST